MQSCFSIDITHWVVTGFDVVEAESETAIASSDPIETSAAINERVEKRTDESEGR